MHPVMPEPVAEVAVDIAPDSAGHWRHPIRLTRTNLGQDDVPLFGAAC